jgi:predicted permease
MRWFYKLPLRFRSLFRKRQVEQELSEELRFHLENLTQEKIAQGMTREEARYAALRELGGVEQIKEECRDMRRVNHIESLLQDLHYGLRQLRRNPGFTAVAIITLALGIGANTAIFSVINAVMLRMLPVQNPEQLVQIGFQGKHSGQSFIGESFSYPLFNKLREHNQPFTDISAFDYWDSLEAHPASSGSVGESVKGQLVSINFFSLLGVDPVIGRTFAPDEDSGASAHPVAVISSALWARMFARSPAVMGKKLMVEGTPFTIIGVAPAHFSGVSPGRVDDFWVPVSMQPQVLPGGNRLTESDTNWLSLIARLKPGVSVKQARANLDVLYQDIQHQHDLSRWSEQDRRDFFTHDVVLLPAASGTDYLRQEFSRPLFLLMAMVGLVLLIACANVADLLLARGNVRQREIAVRLVFGAGRGRLIRQLLTESVLLAFLGGALGVLFAYWASPVLVALMGRGQNGLTLDVHPDLAVLVFTLLVALATGIAFGLVPALRATRISGSESAQAYSRNVTASRSGRTLGRALVVAQVALSLVLIIGAGLLVRTLQNLETLNPGFSRKNVLLFGLDPDKAGYEGQRAAELREELLDRIDHMPGVRSASFSFLTPISGGGWDNFARSVEGYTPYPGEDMDIYLNAVGPRYFETLGTPILLGRDFSPRDRSSSTLVAMINQTMAHHFFGNRNPIGKHFRLGPWTGKRGCEIIGVVGDQKYNSLREAVPPTAYLYIPQLPQALSPGGVTFEVRSAVPPMSLVPQVRNIIQHVDSRLAPSDTRTLAEQVDQSLSQEKLVSALSSFFALLALGLACIGLYGIMSYAVARRTNEIGIRMALGAECHRIMRMILREAFVLVMLGIAIGVPAALAASRLLATMLYGLKVTDPVTILAAVGVMAAVALTAGYIPARRAASVDPMVALRYE